MLFGLFDFHFGATVGCAFGNGVEDPHGAVSIGKVRRRRQSVFDPGHLPPLPAGSAFAFGHIHVKHAERQGDTLILNPGSVSIPKDGSHSCMVYENGTFTAMTLDGEPVASVAF